MPRIPRKRIKVPILPVIAIALILIAFILFAAGGAKAFTPPYHSLPHTGYPNPPYAAAPAHGANPQPTINSPQLPSTA